MRLPHQSSPHVLSLLFLPSPLLPNGCSNLSLIPANPVLLTRVQDPLAVDARLQSLLRLLAQLKVLQGNLPHEVEVLFELFLAALVVVIELHPRDPGIRGGACSEGGHPAAVDIQRADGEEVEEEPVSGACRVGDVLGEVAVVGHTVEGWGVDFRERGVCVLAVETFLEAINPGLVNT